MSEITIASRKIGPRQPVWIVAELSGNARSLEEAKYIIQQAAIAGADAIKCQTYRPQSMTIQSDAEPFLIEWQGKKRTLWDLYSEAAMPWEWQPELKAYTESLGLVWFSTPFNFESADFLESLNVPAYKIASFELVDVNLIRHVARKGKPMILSTGMATRAEINEAVQAADEGIKDRIKVPENRVLASPASVAVLKCTSAYPAPAADCNLRTLEEMCFFAGFERPVGLSDHTLGIAVPVAAVALGACIVEKHICISRAAGGPDSAFSLEPQEFKAMVEAIRTTEAALGEVRYGATESEQEMLRYRRSLFCVQNIAKGTVFTAENVRSIRPAGGLHPRHYDEILGKMAARDIKRGEPLGWEMVSDELPAVIAGDGSIEGLFGGID